MGGRLVLGSRNQMSHLPTIVDSVQCPQCNGESSVIDWRDGEDARRRRRKCNKCSHRYTTYEIHAKDYERMRRLNVDVRQIDSAIATLHEIREQIGATNEHHED